MQRKKETSGRDPVEPQDMVKHIDLMLSSLLDFLQRVHQALTLKPALTETSMFTSLGPHITG
jgi:hypothetical protein